MMSWASHGGAREASAFFSGRAPVHSPCLLYYTTEVPLITIAYCCGLVLLLLLPAPPPLVLLPLRLLPLLLPLLPLMPLLLLLLLTLDLLLFCLYIYHRYYSVLPPCSCPSVSFFLTCFSTPLPTIRSKYWIR